MVPVPEWIPQVALPNVGESYLDAWGPFGTVINGQRLTGLLVLSNYRVLFVRTDLGGVSRAQVQFTIPLNLVHRAVGDQRGREGVVVLNHLEFVFRHDGGASPATTAQAVVQAVTAARNRRLTELHRDAPYGGTAPGGGAPTAVQREREVIREIVRLPCRYCGSLVNQLDTKCGSCGAGLR